MSVIESKRVKLVKVRFCFYYRRLFISMLRATNVVGDTLEAITIIQSYICFAAESKPPPERKVKEKLPKFFVDNAKFQDAVVKEVGSHLKKFYKKHQVSKEDYKEIFKKVMKKICKSSSEPRRLVCVRSIRKLCDFYVQKARLQIKKDCMFSDDVN